MKTTLKKLIANRATLTRIVFVFMFITVTTMAPVRQVEAGFWSDLGDALRDAFGGGGGGGGGGDDGGYTIYGSGEDARITGFGSNTQARNSGEAWIENNDCFGCVVTVSFDGNGGYQAIISHPNDNGGGDPTPTTGDVYGEWETWGHLYAGQYTPCQNGIRSWEPACNFSCTALIGWACDTRSHTDPVSLDLFVNGVLYDTFSPTIPNGNTNPYCGASPNGLAGYRYVTPAAWKDGVTRTITLRATRPDGLQRNIVHAWWNGPTSFPVTCPFEPPVIDLTGSLGTVANQIKDVPFDIDTTIENIGTLAANSSIEVDLRFDFGTDGWHNGTNGDFRVRSTVSALGISAQVGHTFSNITIPKIGDWKVQLFVDPRGVIEPLGSPYRSNNKTNWTDFAVDNPPSTAPALYLSANPNTVQMGGNTTLLWVGENIQPGTCTASGSWGGDKANSGNQTVSVGNVIGNKLYRLSCTGTDGTVISRTASVLVTDTAPTTDITINFWAAPSIIRSGESTRINWDIRAGYVATCEVTHPGGSSSFPITGDIYGNFPTAPITNNQRFTITCTPGDSNNGPVVTKSITVEVIPVAQEV